MIRRTTNAEEVTNALKRHGPGYARNIPIPASVQSISGALRHAEANGWVKRTKDRDGVSVWAYRDGEPALL